jgi:hypothetical protein
LDGLRGDFFAAGLLTVTFFTVGLTAGLATVLALGLLEEAGVLLVDVATR